VGLLTASAADLAKLRQAIDAVPRLEQLIAAVNSKTNKAFPSVWVKPTAAPSSGVHDGLFIEWNNTTLAWDSTGITCKIRERANGRLVVGKPYLGRTVGKTTGRVPLIQVVSSAGETSSDCSDMLGLIRAGKCLHMTIAGTPTGACEGIDTSQTADLRYDDDEEAMISEDLLYGVSPGVLTTICDGGMSTGAPRKWNIVVAGFGSPNENFNQSYTITHSTGETWTATKGGVTVTAVRLLAGWSLTLDDGTYTVTYTTAVAYCCQTIAFDLDDDDGTTTAPATLDMTIATACGSGQSYTPRLERVSGDCGLCLKFTWVPTAGSGSQVIPWKQVGCGEDADGQPYVEFATDDPRICSGEDGAACTGNKVVVRITCRPCVVSLCGSEIADRLCLVLLDVSGYDVYFTILADCLEVGVYKFAGYQVRIGTTYYQPLWAKLTCPGTIEFKTYTVEVSPTCDTAVPGGPWFLAGSVTLASGAGTWSATAGGSGDATISETEDCTDPNSPPQSWNCIPNVGCVEVFDGSGTYSSEADCNADCFGSGGGGGADCPGPATWAFTFAGFDSCLADLNGSHLLAYWYTSGGVKTWIKDVTIGGYTCYLQISAGLLAGVPYVIMSLIQYSGTRSNQVQVLGTWGNQTAGNCCSSMTLTGAASYCPAVTAYSSAYGGTAVPSVVLTPSGACT